MLRHAKGFAGRFTSSLPPNQTPRYLDDNDTRAASEIQYVCPAEGPAPVRLSGVFTGSEPSFRLAVRKEDSCFQKFSHKKGTHSDLLLYAFAPGANKARP